MERKEINIVWLKRDIRSQDHEALQLAEQSRLPYMIIYIFEPSVISYPDTSLRHLQFQYHSLLKLNEKLQPYHRSVLLFHGEALAVLSHIHQHYKISHIFSYQESGTTLTFQRDKAVARYCTAEGISWRQCQRDGIVRGLKNRQGWDQQWYATMHASIIVNTYSPGQPLPISNPFPLPRDLRTKLDHYPKSFQPPGEDNAFRYLESFVKERGKYYSRHISKPQESRNSCGRISPYISWGNISVRQAYQLVSAYSASKGAKKSFQAFLTRLKWHCHFIQKFEMECSYEHQCINAGYELLNHPLNEAFVQAWKTAQTGFPLIDACMKCLQETGWLNFRMRAMLVSFLCHHLNQDWRTGTYHLAGLFLDYEPGIHYPQFQMQAGTTGINTIRIYNPVKQSKEHDPDGLFIKRWLPQLEPVPTSFIHEPHRMTLIEQQMCQVQIGKDYPLPIVNIATSAKTARTVIWGHRNNALVKAENKRILLTHTRRKDEHENLS